MLSLDPGGSGRCRRSVAMWKLQPVASGAAAGEPQRLLTGVEYVVGRKNCAILIQDDQSISRAHATLSVSHSAANLTQTAAVPELIIKDMSKYGTFVNEEKLQTDSPRLLKSGDRLTFGVFNSKFRVEYEPLIVCSSCLDASAKTALNHSVLQLGGHVVNNWTEDCTHLVMTSVKVTVKTICALICCRPIIEPDYFTEYSRAIQSKQQLPIPESFYPPVDEPAINSETLDLSGRQERRNIFRGKSILFLNAKQYKKLSPAIVLGGGEAKLLTEGSKETSLLECTGACVIDVGFTNSQASVSEGTRKWIDTIMTLLQRRGHRAIPESEIGLAVIFMTTKTYCNPETQLGVESSAVSRTAISGPTISQSMAVDETIMPGPTLNITAYVADTESPEQLDTWMDITGNREVKETPKSEQRSKANTQDISTVKETLSSCSTVNTGAPSIKKDRKTGSQQKTHQQSLTDVWGAEKSEDRTSQQQCNIIKNYFPSVTKKRERVEEGGEMSLSKLAKIDEQSSVSPDQNQLETSAKWKNGMQQNSQKISTGSPESNLSSAVTNIKTGLGTSKAKNNETITRNILCEEPEAKKRKELDDLVVDADIVKLVFESGDPEWKSKMESHAQEDRSNTSKKRRLDSETNIDKGDVKDKKIKEENKTASSPQGLQEDSDILPSRLLVTEFRSLVVSHPTQNNQSSIRTEYQHVKNFKKFKKVAFPGAGELPYIIGGSDLIAHHTKKNSELEQWLRQEMEEQSQHAREESLADDLFRYDPKSVKRRR
ncbi:nibrin [Rhinatrema bivittatum]|uniref:nibrin n=1 Tax=Rhinatrema bivittatum TaxID=194408 RepID=UPI00112ADE50|nr:nibrin [Rhinatrema bivittatum]